MQNNGCVSTQQLTVNTKDDNMITKCKLRLSKTYFAPQPFHKIWVVENESSKHSMLYKPYLKI